jgi:hypothetical protein
MRPILIIMVMGMLTACHPGLIRVAEPASVCPPPTIVTRAVRVPAPAPKPLTPDGRRRAERRAAKLRAEADRLDAQLHAILKGQGR